MPNASLAGAHILVIAKDRQTGGRFAKVLADLGCAVTWTATEEEALRAAANPEIDVAIVDLNLGSRAALSIAGHFHRRWIPIILCGEFSHGYRTGAYRGVPVLSKRFRESDVAGALRAALRWSPEAGDWTGQDR